MAYFFYEKKANTNNCIPLWVFLNHLFRYSEITRCSLRSLISYVPQKPFIFRGTIRDNIMISNVDASEDEGIWFRYFVLCAVVLVNALVKTFLICHFHPL